MARPKLRLGRLCKTMGKTMAVVDEPGTRVPRLYRRWECVNAVWVIPRPSIEKNEESRQTLQNKDLRDSLR